MSGTSTEISSEEMSIAKERDESREFTARPSVMGAVQELRSRRPAMRAKGIFKHPPEWTQEEKDFIADALKMNLPIHTIAGMVRCERHTLSSLIEKTPELRQLREEKYDNMLDTAEYQADRLMQAGNASMVMFVLQTMGRKRGWSSEDQPGEEGDAESRIVMGLIPEEEVSKADAVVKETKAGDRNAGGVLTDPVALAAVQETVDNAVQSRIEERVKAAVETALPKPIDVNDVKVSEPSYSDMESTAAEFGPMGFGAMNPAMDAGDPWADGGNSMFAQ